MSENTDERPTIDLKVLMEKLIKLMEEKKK